jgi:hypothetical protein
MAEQDYLAAITAMRELIALLNIAPLTVHDIWWQRREAKFNWAE